MPKIMKPYAVGYKRPPKEARFKKGHSGNPRGRPKKRASFSETFLTELEKQVPVTLNGRRRFVYRLEALANRIVLGAANGDPKMIKLLIEVLSRFDGKSFQPICEIRMTRAEMEI